MQLIAANPAMQNPPETDVAQKYN